MTLAAPFIAKLAAVLAWAALATATARAQPIVSEDASRPAFDVRARAAIAAVEADGTALLRGSDDPADGPPRVTILAGDATLIADAAVVQSRKLPGSARRRLDIALLGNASWEVAGSRSEGDELAVDLVATGPIDFDVRRRRPRAAEDDDLFARAADLFARVEADRLDAPTPSQPPVQQTTSEWDDLGTAPGDAPADVPGTTRPQTLAPIGLAGVQAGELRTVLDDRGKTAAELSGGVFVIRQLDDGSIAELRADRAVVFTDLDRLDAAAQLGSGDDYARLALGVYLEGDVRATFTTPAPGGLPSDDRRLRAERAYVDFTTGRATLGDAVLHARAEGYRNLPLTVRASTIRRVSEGEYEVRGAQLSTSAFRTPMLSLNASRAFVREIEGGGPIERTFGADNVTPRVFGVPVLYLPVVRGAAGDARLPLRSVNVGSSRNTGPYVSTQWGLRETLGLEPVEDFDATYFLNYYGERGLAGGGGYRYGSDLYLPFGGGRPTIFNGGGRLELLNDHGRDNLPGRRLDIDRDFLRGRLDLYHSQYFPNGAAQGGEDYALFARYGVLSDATYLEIWDRRRFYTGPPHDLRLDVTRRTQDTFGALTFNLSTEDFATSAEQVVENAGVERLPELTAGTYGRRVGPFTTIGEVRAGLIAFDRLSLDPAADLRLRGFAGIPTYGYTGQSETVNPRIDVREEIAYAGLVGPVRARPYLVARATGWGASPDDGGPQVRALAGAGLRLATTFARVDDRVFSRLLGIDRLRHLVEPYADGFAGLAAGADVSEAYIYDEHVDAYASLAAAKIGVRQRFQTYRGPPGGKHSVDVLTVDLSTTQFADKDDDVQALDDFRFQPGGGTLPGPFRGVYHPSRPEASIPVDVAEANVAWQISDTLEVTGDGTYGLDTDQFLILNGGLELNRGDRFSGAVGTSYLVPFDAIILGGRLRYQISDRYFVEGRTKFDLDLGRFRGTTASIRRRFERAVLQVDLFFDRIDEESGIRVFFSPSDVPLLRFDSNTLTE